MVDDRNRRAAMAIGSAIRIAPHTNAKAHSMTVSNVSSDMNNTMTPVKTVEVTRSSQDRSGFGLERRAISPHRRLSLWF